MTNVYPRAGRIPLFIFSCLGVIIGSVAANAQWRHVTSLSDPGVYCLLVQDPFMYAGVTNGIARSTDDGTTWTGLSGEPPYQMILHNGLIEAAIYGQIMVSADSGRTWTYTFLDVEPIFTIVAQGLCVFAGSGILPNGEGGPVGIFRTTDDWANWVQVNNGFESGDTRALVSDGNSLYAGTANGVFCSINNGDYWKRTFIGIPDTDITALAIKGPWLYTGTSGGHIYRSSDGGWNWTEANQGIPATSIVRAFAFNGSMMFTGTSGGLFVSYNNGTTWQAADPGPGPTDVKSLAIKGPLLFAGDYSTGLWVDTLSRFITDVNDAPTGERPDAFSLSQNFPNPFNPTTTIEYTIGGVVALSGAMFSGVEGRAYMNVRLVVYDLLGREVATLVNERKEPGRYEVEFSAGGRDGSGLTSGTYFYRLQAGEFVETRRMVLLK